MPRRRRSRPTTTIRATTIGCQSRSLINTTLSPNRTELETTMVEDKPQDMVERIDAGVVEIPFSSEYRRHRKGDPVTRAEREKSRLDFDRLVESGFMVEQQPGEAPAEQPVVAPASQKDKEPS